MKTNPRWTKGMEKRTGKSFIPQPPQKCKHERIESNMVPEQCADCGKLTYPPQGVSEEWSKVRKNLQKTLEKFPKLAMDCIDSASLYWIEREKKEKETQRKELLKVLEGMKRQGGEFGWCKGGHHKGDMICDDRCKYYDQALEDFKTKLQ